MNPLFDNIVKHNLFPVYPLVEFGKYPRIEWIEGQNKHYKKDIEDLGEYVTRISSSGKEVSEILTGYTISLGEESNILVVDLDNHNDGINGVENFKNIVKDLGIKPEDLATLTVSTPRKGYHLYFKYKDGLKTGANGDLGIDLKVTGAIVGGGSVVNVELKEGEDPTRYIQYKTLNKRRRKNKNSFRGKYTVVRDLPIIELPEPLYNWLINTFGAADNTKKKIKKTRSTSSTYFEPVATGSRNVTAFKFLNSITRNNMIQQPENMKAILKMFCNQYMEEPLDDKEINTIVDQVAGYLNPWYCNDKGRVIIGSLMKEFKLNHECYAKGSLIYVYDPNEGFYKTMDKYDLNAWYNDHVKDEDINTNKQKNFRETVLDNIPVVVDTFDFDNNYICCKNGIFDIKNKKIISYDPKYKLDSKFNGNYIEDREEYKIKFENSKFKKFIESIVEPDSVRTLQQIFGLVLCPNSAKVNKCVLLVGDGSNGKSTLFEIMEHMLIDKEEHISRLSVNDIGGEFSLSACEGKRLNVCRDDESRRFSERAFKSLICGEPVAVNRKFQDIKNIRFNLLWIAGFNRLPSTSDKSYGWFRRQLLLVFNHTFGTQDEIDRGVATHLKIIGIDEEIKANEMDIVINWAIDGLIDLIENCDWNVYKSEKMIQDLKEYQEDCDSTVRFFNTCCMKSMGSYVRQGDLYKYYCAWCDEQGIPKQYIPRDAEFRKSIKGNFKIETDKKGGYAVYKDLRYIVQHVNSGVPAEDPSIKRKLKKLKDEIKM